MKPSDNFQDRLDAYLLGELQGTELAAFEALLAAQPELAQQAQEAQDLKDGLVHFGNEQMRARLRRIKQETISEETPPAPAKVRPLRPRLIWGAAAAVGLLLIAAYLFLLTPPTPQEYFAQHYEAYPISLTARDADNSDTLALLNQSYSQGRYQQSLDLIQELLQSPGFDQQLLLAAGICALETQQAPQALAYFQQLIDANDALYADQARWYAALTFLQQDQPQAALPLLESLSARPDADHHQDAQELLQALKK